MLSTQLFSSRNFANSLKWTKPKNADLTKFLKVGDIYHSCGFITLDKTTNRVNKPDYEIFSTPSMIDCMSKAVISKINDNLPTHNAALSTRVTCMHKAPMPLGGHYNITAKADKVESEKALFSVDCCDDAKKVIGVAKIEIGIVGF